MKIKTRRMAMVTTLVCLATVTTFIGNACSRQGGDSTAQSNTSLSDTCSVDEVNFEIIPGAETVSITYGPQVLQNMQACLGVNTLSSSSQDEFTARSSSLSEFGSVLDLNPPMAMGYAALAVEVCQDLWNQESVLAAANRRIFNAIDPNISVGSAAIGETLRRLARACWGRNETDEEKNTVVDAVSQIRDAGQAGGETNRLVALSICSGALASVDGFRQ